MENPEVSIFKDPFALLLSKLSPPKYTHGHWGGGMKREKR
jgi:hypothetical protein